MAENKKLPSLDQLKLLALRAKADSASRVGELAELVAQAIEDVEHFGSTVTLPAANWNGRAQTIQNDSLVADSNYYYFVGADADSHLVYSDAGVRADNVTVNGQITFHCEIIPESDLTVHILRLEVET